MKSSGYFLGAAIGLLGASAGGATIEFRPVGGTDNTITVMPTYKVTLEIYVSGWAPDVLAGYQVDLDVNGYSNGIGTDLIPYTPNCTSDYECDSLVGYGSDCNVPVFPPGCTSVFIDSPRTDYVFWGLSSVPAVNGSSSPDYRLGGALLEPAISDPGGRRYAGTVVLYVPAGAIGAYTFGFDPGPGTYLSSPGQSHIPNVDLVPATINVWRCSTVADCDDGNLCTFDVCTSDGACGYAQAPQGTACDDNDVCTAFDVCSAEGVCSGFVPLGGACNDGDPCTSDSCHPIDGCSNVPIPGCGGGSCSPDADGDSIQDSVDDPVGGFLDNTTTPSTRGGILYPGDQDLCVSDAPSGYGVRAESVGTIGGGSTPASLQLVCVVPTTDIKTGNVTAGDCITMTCRTEGGSAVAEILNSCPGTVAGSETIGTRGALAAAASDVTLELLAGGLVVGTVVLPESNALSWNPLSRAVTASASNNTTLIVVSGAGEEQLPAGQTAALPELSAIPSVSQWGIVVLALLLLIGARVQLRRRQVMLA